MVEGEDVVPVCILGSSPYPMLAYLMKEFSDGGGKPTEQFFRLQNVIIQNGY